MPHVLSTGGWDEMRWKRWTDLEPGDPNWAIHVVDTSDLSAGEVAAAVIDWCRRVRSGDAPVMRVPA
jgi:hypothetical protein